MRGSIHVAILARCGYGQDPAAIQAGEARTLDANLYILQKRMLWGFIKGANPAEGMQPSLNA
jgi:hypothetical protein